VTGPSLPDDGIRALFAEPSGTLACGEDVDELIEQAADGRAAQLTEHQQQCPHCQAALREFSQIWAPVRIVAAEPVRLPAGVRSAVLRQIRKLTADAWYTLEIADGGVIRIAARVVARIARDAARQVPGVRVVFGRSTQARIAGLAEAATLQHRHPHAAAGVLGRTAVVDLALAAEYGLDLEAVAREVQNRAIAELRSQAGLQDVTVNVTIDDVIA
jgi:uncharacterized alkaline shock family protein YloU